jgi:phage tail P2-like protein
VALVREGAGAFERAMDKVAERRFAAIDAQVMRVLDPATCPLPLLPWLARHYGLLNFSSEWPESTQRASVADARKVLRRRGMPISARLAVESYGAGIEIFEWWQDPGATPGTWRVVLGEGSDPGIDPIAQDEVLEALRRIKPLARPFIISVPAEAEETVRVDVRVRAMQAVTLSVTAEDGAPGGGAVTLLDWGSDLTFARASAATYWDGTEVTEYAADDARILSGGELYVEGSRENAKRDYAGQYNPIGGVFTADVGDGLIAGDGDADELDGDGANNPQIQTLAPDWPSYAPSSAGSLSLWFRRTSGDTSDVRLRLRNKAGAFVNLDLPPPSSWTRLVHSIADLGAGSSSQFHSVLFAGTGRTIVGEFWGYQIENAAFASQLILSAGSATTRAVDDASVASASVPAAMRSGSFEIVVTPRRASTEAADTATETLLAYGAGTDDRIYISGSNEIVVRQGGANAVTTGALTWSADQAITLTFDASAGSVTVAGATTGDGTTTDTSWTMPAGDVQVGNDAALSTAFFGALSEPVAP